MSGLCYGAAKDEAGNLSIVLSKISAYDSQTAIAYPNFKDVTFQGRRSDDTGNFATIRDGVFATPFCNRPLGSHEYIPTDETGLTAYGGTIPEDAITSGFNASDAAFTKSGILFILDGDFGLIYGLSENEDGAYTEVETIVTIVDPRCGDSLQDGTYYSSKCDFKTLPEMTYFDLSNLGANPLYIRKAKDLVAIGNTVYTAILSQLYQFDLD